MGVDPRGQSTRSFLGLLAAGFGVLLALLEVTFLRFPAIRDSSGTGPKANVAMWFGSHGAGWFYLGFGLVSAGLYLWVVLTGGGSANSRGRWWLGGLLSAGGSPWSGVVVYVVR